MTDPDDGLVEGLRERKKRLMRQLLSDTATEMFLRDGFEQVTVADVAAACGVSEKTVYNYFPSKEDLLLDREEQMTAALRAALGPEGSDAPVDAVLGLLDADLDEIATWYGEQRNPRQALRVVRRMAALVESTDSLRAHQRDMMDRLVQAAAEALAERSRLSPDDPEPQIAADALVGLYRVQFRALIRHADGGTDPDAVRDAVTAEVRRAARLVETGLWSLSAVLPGSPAESRGDAGAAAALQARTQVVAALREARRAFESLREAGREHDAAQRRSRSARHRRPDERADAPATGRAAVRQAKRELVTDLKLQAIAQAGEKSLRALEAKGAAAERAAGRRGR